MSLTQELADFAASNGVDNMPKEVQDAFQVGMQEMLAKGINENALNVGDTVPDFEMPNQLGDPVKLSDLLADGPLVISFYRGAWCPYCNIELNGLQRRLPEITDLGAKLVAISPELPDNSLSLVEKNELSFDVLSDQGNKVADAFGLVFTLAEALQPLYKQFGIDLEAVNGDASMTLPTPATYVVDTDRKIIGAYVDVDYSTRMDPDDIVAALQAD